MFVENYFQRFRVFIFGLEVTDDLLSVSFSCADGRAPSTANITLSNVGREAVEGQVDPRTTTFKYVMTAADIANLYEGVDLELLSPPEEFFETRVELRANKNRKYRAPAGATLGQVAQQLGTNVDDLLAVNPAFNTARAKSGRSPGGWLFVQPVREEVPVLNAKQRADLFEARFKAINEQARRNTETYFIDPKKTILQRKFGVTVDISDSNIRQKEDGTIEEDPRVSVEDINADQFDLQGAADISNLYSIAGRAPTFPFAANIPVFHTSDPVRIFMNDPARPNEWYFAFAGKVSSWDVQIDSKEDSKLSITVEDVRRELKYGRISVNPGVIDDSAGTVEKDLVIRDFQSIPLRDKPLEEKVYTLLFGTDLDAIETVGTGEGLEVTTRFAYNGSDQFTVISKGVANLDYNRSATFLFGEAGREADINSVVARKRITLDTSAGAQSAFQSYLAYVDTRVRPAHIRDLYRGSPVVLNRALRAIDVNDIDAVVKYIGENPQYYPPDGGRLHFLLPSSLGVGGDIDTFLLGFNDVASKTSFVNRLGLILDILEPLDFTCFVNGIGDIHIELPLRDFDPWDMGTSTASGAAVRRAFNGTVPVGLQDTFRRLAESADFPAFAERYRFRRRDEASHSMRFVDERIKNIMRTHFFATPLDAEQGQFSDVNVAIVKMPALIAAFGPRAETHPPDFYYGGGDGVARKAAKFWAATALNANNADAFEVTLDTHPPRPGIMPNRTVEVFEHGYVATIRNVEYSWKPGTSTAEMKLNMNSVRQWRGGKRLTGEQKPPRYYPSIAGVVGQPLDYAERLGVNRPENRESPEPEEGADG